MSDDATRDLARIADALERIARHLEGEPKARRKKTNPEDVEITPLDLAAADAVAKRYGVTFTRKGRR